jgi:hypothetical protein
VYRSYLRNLLLKSGCQLGKLKAGDLPSATAKVGEKSQGNNISHSICYAVDDLSPLLVLSLVLSRPHPALYRHSASIMAEIKQQDVVQDHDILGDKANMSHEEAAEFGKLTPEELEIEKKLRRKIDTLIMPLVVLVYLMNYIVRYSAAPCGREAGLLTYRRIGMRIPYVRSRIIPLSISLTDIEQQQLRRSTIARIGERPRSYAVAISDWTVDLVRGIYPVS